MHIASNMNLSLMLISNKAIVIGLHILLLIKHLTITYDVFGRKAKHILLQLQF